MPERNHVEAEIERFIALLASTRSQSSQITGREQKARQGGNKKAASDERQSRVRLAGQLQARADAFADFLGPDHPKHLRNLATCLRTYETPEGDDVLTSHVTALLIEHSKLGKAADARDVQALERLAERLDAAADAHSKHVRAAHTKIVQAAAKLAETEALIGGVHRSISDLLEQDPAADPATDGAVLQARARYKSAIDIRRKATA
ncbi:MAG: hypothetical protein ABJM82_16900 [Shimia thalassica]|uniref:hypothetical protein n=1 Tax=Shimia thalassica TaxID=1715693 RepID=UPI0032989F5D